jgi:hypothetical protein
MMSDIYDGMNRCRNNDRLDLRRVPVLNSRPAKDLAPGGASVPANLAEWVEPGLLVLWIEEEIDRLRLDASQGKAVAGLSANSGPSLLPLLSYAYATRIFNTQEIVRACHTDPLFRFLCENQVPFPQEIIRFRRTFREVLQQVLAGLFRRAVAYRFDLDESHFPEEIERDFQARGAERILMARHMDVADD